MKNKTFKDRIEELEKDKAIITNKACMEHRRYSDQCMWTILSIILNMVLTIALIGRYL